jgi:hypothetical protein
MSCFKQVAVQVVQMVHQPSRTAVVVLVVSYSKFYI